MDIGRILTVAVISLGGALAGANSANQIAPKTNSGNLTEYYFEFTGQNGEENQPAKWKEITQQEYQLEPCEGLVRGCALIATDVTPDANNKLHPTQVYVDQDPNNPQNMAPKEGVGIQNVINKEQSY